MAEPTSQELLNRIDNAVDALEAAQNTVAGAAGQIANAVHKTGDESISGVKNFTENPLVPTPESGDESNKVTNTLFVQRIAKSLDSRLTAAQAKADSASDKADAAQGTADKAVADAAAAQATADGKVSKNGDTMSGDLILRSDKDQTEIPEDYFARALIFRDKANHLQGFVRAYNEAGESVKQYVQMSSRIVLPDNSQRFAYISAISDVNGPSYGTCPPPRETVNENDIDTRAASVARHPLNLPAHPNYYVDPDSPNASDTMDLFQGRGLSKDMPFASLSGVIDFINARFIGGLASIVLLSDCELNRDHLYLNTSRLVLYSYNSSKLATIHMKQGFILGNGFLEFANVIFNTDTNSITTFLEANSLYGYASGITLQHNIDFIGSVSYATLTATAGTVFIPASSTIGGSVTGRRYVCQRRGTIIVSGKGANAIPGTEAGIADTGSLYL